MRSRAGARAKRSGCSSRESAWKRRSRSPSGRWYALGTPSTSKKVRMRNTRGRLELNALAAAAAPLHIRVLELEPVAHQAGDEVERGAGEVQHALLVDE